MSQRSRREFLADVGRGMLAGSLGVSLAAELGLGSVFAEDGADFPTFGELEPLVSMMQEAPLAKLQTLLVEKLRGGTDLRTLTAAGALANARTFAGQDYTGFHTFMALAPAYEMSRALPEARRALPILKVLYRNTNRIHEFGGRAKQILRNVEPAKIPANSPTGELLRKATRSGDFGRAESTFAALVNERPDEAFNHLQYSVRDEINVHRVVLAWRAWSMLDNCRQRALTHLVASIGPFLCQFQKRRSTGRDPQPPAEAPRDPQAARSQAGLAQGRRWLDQQDEPTHLRGHA